jgi:hypothetical protein
MPGKAKEKLAAKQWIVPMRFVRFGSVSVTAMTAEEAMTKARCWDHGEADIEMDETTEWDVDGQPKLNE